MSRYEITECEYTPDTSWDRRWRVCVRRDDNECYHLDSTYKKALIGAKAGWRYHRNKRRQAAKAERICKENGI